jgi:RimJ/RimL family protein N-acetyltransferase
MKLSTLEGQFIRHEPLGKEHLPALEKHFKPELTQFYPRPFANVEEYYNDVIENEVFGNSQVFATIWKATGEPIGCSGYFNLDPANRKLEIGGTWLSPQFQLSPANVESKLLLLTHAFENRDCYRVEFKTDSLNVRSQAALEKLGVVREGTLRNHMLIPGGRRRHSIYYSVIVEEWPETRLKVLNRLAAKSART